MGTFIPSCPGVQHYRRAKHDTKKTLAELAGQQRHIKECPVFFVICADYSRLKQTSEIHHQTFLAKEVEQVLVGAVDAALVAENMLLAARSFGLGGVMIGGIRNEPDAVAKLLRLPEYTFPVMGLCVGYPERVPEQKPRLPQKLVVHEEHYSEEKRDELLKMYDQITEDYYKERTGGKRVDTWGNQMANHFSKPNRPHVGEFIRKQGFLE